MRRCLSVRYPTLVLWEHTDTLFTTVPSSIPCWLSRFRSQDKPHSPREKGKDADDAEDSDDEGELERVSVEDAWLFPVVRVCPCSVRIVQERLPVAF